MRLSPITLQRAAQASLRACRPRQGSALPVLAIASSSRRSPVPSPKPSRIFVSRSYATSTSEPTSPEDPALARSQELIELANTHLEQGDLDQARGLLKQSVEIKESSIGYFNLGVCDYQLKNIKEAIASWDRSIQLSPSPDAHTNIASAYILSQPPEPALAIQHLTKALELAPDDAEIAFNLGAVLELTLTLYQKAQQGGIERAAQNVRNIGAKILARKAEEADKKGEPPQ